MIALLWAHAILNNKKSFDEVPRMLKGKVREILDENGYEWPEDNG